MIHRFEVEVEITKTIIVEIDDEIFDQAAQDNYNSGFHYVDNLLEHAENIAELIGADYEPRGVEGYSDNADWTWTPDFSDPTGDRVQTYVGVNSGITVVIGDNYIVGLAREI